MIWNFSIRSLKPPPLSHLSFLVPRETPVGAWTHMIGTVLGSTAEMSGTGQPGRSDTSSVAVLRHSDKAERYRVGARQFHMKSGNKGERNTSWRPRKQVLRTRYILPTETTIGYGPCQIEPGRLKKGMKNYSVPLSSVRGQPRACGMARRPCS